MQIIQYVQFYSVASPFQVAGPRLTCHHLAADVLGRHHVKATNCSLQLDGDIEALGVVVLAKFNI